MRFSSIAKILVPTATVALGVIGFAMADRPNPPGSGVVTQNAAGVQATLLCPNGAYYTSNGDAGCNPPTQDLGGTAQSVNVLQASGDGGTNDFGQQTGSFTIIPQEVISGHESNGPVVSDVAVSSSFTNDAGTTWVTVWGPFTPAANSFSVVEPEVAIADFSGDAGYTFQGNFVDCNVKFYVQGMPNRQIEFVEGSSMFPVTTGATPVQALTPFGCHNMTGCTNATGDAGCVVGQSMSPVTGFQVSYDGGVDGGVIVQAEGPYLWKSTTPGQVIRRKQGSP